VTDWGGVPALVQRDRQRLPSRLHPPTQRLQSRRRFAPIRRARRVAGDLRFVQIVSRKLLTSPNSRVLPSVEGVARRRARKWFPVLLD
jgi:hypothetical protein